MSLILPNSSLALVSRSPKGAAPSSLLTGIISYWKMDEVSGTRVDSVIASGNDLTDNNTVGSTSGIISLGGNFIETNSEFLSRADNSSFDFTTTFSIAGWVNPLVAVANRTIAAKWNYATDGAWAFQTGSGTATGILVAIATTPTDPGTGCVMFFADAGLAAGAFHSFALIYDGSQTGDANRLKLYTDNTARTLTVSAGAVPATLLNSAAPFNIGTFPGLGRYFGGIIDEVGLWNRPLTALEVATLYNGGSGITYPF